ncbi:MAG: TraB/GumN family protein [Nitrospinales bacterium]
MKKWKLLYALFFIVFIFVPPAQADSPVWEVVKGDNQLFIGGTIHVLTQTDYPLPSTFEKAYSQSVKLVFETDMQKMNSPEFQKVMLSALTYSDGRNLKQVLNEDTYQELEQHFSSRGISMVNMVNFKPGMVAITLTVIELQRLGLVGAGVDDFFLLRALNDQKELGQLETVDEQLAFISTMGDGQENEMIAYTLRDIKNLPVLMQSIKDAWRCGDIRKLKEVAITPFKKDFPEVYDEFIVKRNNAWIPQIEAMLKTKDVEFVLVGALHLVGDDGVIAQLAARGYVIQML